MRIGIYQFPFRNRNFYIRQPAPNVGERSKQVAAENFISVFHVDDFIRVTCEYGEYGTCFLTE